MSGEYQLPEDLSLNTAIDEAGEEIQADLASFVSDLGDLLDLDREFYVPEKPHFFWDLSESLAVAISHPEYKDSTETHAAAYRAMCFADQITISAMPVQTLKYNFHGYVTKINATGNPAQALVDDAYTYLSSRQHVNNLLAQHIEVISRSSDQNIHEVATIIGAIVFKLAEEGIAREYQKSCLDQLAKHASNP